MCRRASTWRSSGPSRSPPRTGSPRWPSSPGRFKERQPVSRPFRLPSPCLRPRAASRRRLPVAAVVLGLGVLVAGALFAWRRTHAGASASAGPKVLAVLPFENLGDSADAYFADGVAEAVRGKLARVAGLEVIARGSSNQYRHTTKSPQEIARELGADYLLTATVRWEKAPGGGSRVRVTPELVDVGPGRAPRTRWQESFDASLTDVFQVQADIATKVAGALDVALGDSARRDLAAQPTQSLAAYDAFLKGEAASQAMSVSDPIESAAGDRFLRARRGARFAVRDGLGTALPRPNASLRERRSRPCVGRAGAACGGARPPA